MLAWIIDGRPSTTVIRDMRSGKTTIVESEPHGLFGYPVATDSFVAWAEASGTAIADVGGYVFQPDTSALNSLGNTAGLYDISGAGSIIGWQDSKTPFARPQDISTTLARIK